MIYFLLLGLAFWIVVGAVRIILGWIIPASTMNAIDAAFWKLCKLCFQFIIIAFAGLIVYAIWAGLQSQ